MILSIEKLVLWARSKISGNAVAGDTAENPEHEIRNPKQCQMTKIQMIQTTEFSTVFYNTSFWSLDPCVFKFVSYLDIRIWDLKAAIH